MPIDELIVRLGKIRNALFEVREKRVHPAKDEKVLVDWNGLMIGALARASQVLGEKKYFEAAAKAADFVLTEMKTEDGGIYHRYAKGESGISGFLDDYAYFVFGLIELYEAGFDEEYLQTALKLTRTMIERFWDQGEGGFFFTEKNTNGAVLRLKQIYDGAVPSGNSVALHNLLRLARLSVESGLEDYAGRLLKAFSEDVSGHPLSHTFMLVGLDFALGPNFNVVLVGDPSDKNTLALLEALRENYLPSLTVKLSPSEKSLTASLGAVYEKLEDKPTAYVCRDQTCMPPTNNINKMMEMLKI